MFVQPQEAPGAEEKSEPEQPLPQQQQEPEQQPEQQKEAEQQRPAGNIGLDRSMSLHKIDPLQFVKSPMPLLSEDRKRAPERALGKLEEAAARDETCIWQRVSIPVTTLQTPQETPFAQHKRERCCPAIPCS